MAGMTTPGTDQIIITYTDGTTETLAGVTAHTLVGEVLTIEQGTTKTTINFRAVRKFVVTAETAPPL